MQSWDTRTVEDLYYVNNQILACNSEQWSKLFIRKSIDLKKIWSIWLVQECKPHFKITYPGKQAGGTCPGQVEMLRFLEMQGWQWVLFLVHFLLLRKWLSSCILKSRFKRSARIKNSGKEQIFPCHNKILKLEDHPLDDSVHLAMPTQDSEL